MRARRVGSLAAEALAQNRRGVVLSVQARTVNLLLNDGPLISLLPQDAPLHPWALTVPLDPSAFASIAEGDAVRVAEDLLDAGPLHVVLEDVEVPELRLRRRLRVPPAEAMRLLPRLVRPPAGEGPFEPVLAAALERFRAGGAAAALALLVGVGEGLTPSGDDILVGTLAGLDAARGVSLEAAALREDLVAALAGCAARTTRLSAQMLAAAAAGLYAEPVLGVLEALAADAPDVGALQQAVAALLAVGNHTGRDTLHGIATALERLIPVDPRSAGEPRASAARSAPPTHASRGYPGSASLHPDPHFARVPPAPPDPPSAGALAARLLGRTAAALGSPDRSSCAESCEPI